MSDEITPLRSKGSSWAEPDASTPTGFAVPALAYDYFKSPVSLTVATPGAILTLGGTVFGRRIAPWQMEWRRWSSWPRA